MPISTLLPNLAHMRTKERPSI